MEPSIHLCNNSWHKVLKLWKSMLGVRCTFSSCIYTSNRNYASLCAMFSKALNYEKHFFSVTSFCVYRGLSILTQVLSPWWLRKMHWRPLFSAVPFDLCNENSNKDFFQPVPPFFSLWGITSIKITGLRDQLLLGDLSFLLAASFFAALAEWACSNKCLNLC